MPEPKMPAEEVNPGGGPSKSIPVAGQKPTTMIPSSVPLEWDVNHPLSWDTEDEICSWNNEHPEGGRPSQALREPGDKDEGKIMIEKGIPMSWDTGGEICSWNRERQEAGAPPREGTTNLEPMGKNGVKAEMIKSGVPLSWDLNKPVSWMEEIPEGERPTRALREPGEEAPVMIQPRSIPLGWDPMHPLSWDPSPREAQALKDQKGVSG